MPPDGKTALASVEGWFGSEQQDYSALKAAGATTEEAHSVFTHLEEIKAVLLPDKSVRRALTTELTNALSARGESALSAIVSGCIVMLAEAVLMYGPSKKTRPTINRSTTVTNLHEATSNAKRLIQRLKEISPDLYAIHRLAVLGHIQSDRQDRAKATAGALLRPEEVQAIITTLVDLAGRLDRLGDGLESNATKQRQTNSKNQALNTYTDALQISILLHLYGDIGSTAKVGASLLSAIPMALDPAVGAIEDAVRMRYK